MKKLNFIKENPWLWAIMLLAASVRLFHLGFQGAWLDEIHTLKESDPLLTLPEFHQVIMMREGIPHFYFLCIRYLSEIFGSNIITARIFSAIPGILSVYYIFRLGKAMYSKQAGNMAALFLAVNLLHIEYSQEARSYSLMVLFIIIAFYRLVLFLQNRTFKKALLLGLFAGLISNAHPIGLVNIAAIYLILLIGLIAVKGKSTRITFFKYAFVSGIVTLLVFSPVYQIVAKVSDIQSYWLPAPTFASIKQVFIDLSGRSEIIFYLLLLITAAYAVAAIISAGKKMDGLLSNRKWVSFVIIFIWFGVEASIIIIKSYSGTSLMIPRYFIGLLPAMMLFLAIGIAQFRNRIVTYSLTAIIAATMLFQIFSPVNYYTTHTKSQFEDVCAEVIKGNPDNNIVVTNWGWLLSYYLDRDYQLRNVREMSLESYLTQVKDNAVDQETFWYIDGNSRPYALSPELQQFTDENYTVAKTITLQDAWAKLFVSKKIAPTDQVAIDLNRFSGGQYDGAGNLMFFENLKYSYPPFVLQPGDYEITITACSQPDPPIAGENAKMNILVNGNVIKNLTLSEKNNSEIKLDYTQKQAGAVRFEMAFTNDLSTNGKDRNIKISRIGFKKK